MIESFLTSFSSTYLSLPEITQAFIVVIAVMAVSMAGPFYNNRTVGIWADHLDDDRYFWMLPRHFIGFDEV